MYKQVPMTTPQDDFKLIMSSKSRQKHNKEVSCLTNKEFVGVTHWNVRERGAEGKTAHTGYVNG